MTPGHNLVMYRFRASCLVVTAAESNRTLMKRTYYVNPTSTECCVLESHNHHVTLKVHVQ